jgi:hypothetical protein
MQEPTKAQTKADRKAAKKIAKKNRKWFVKKRFYIPAIFIVLIILAGQNAPDTETTSKETPKPSPTISVNEPIRKANCNALEEYTSGDWSKDSWNTYDEWAYAEEAVWEKISKDDIDSYNAILELRRVDYAANMSLPPEVGQIWLYPGDKIHFKREDGKKWNSAEPSDSDTGIDLPTDEESRAAIDGVLEVCPSLDPSDWEQAFALN